MKILFIQLPLVDHSYSYINGNVDYATAVLSGFIRKHFPDVYCESLPAVLANFCSNELILKYVRNTAPDVVSFTSYLWNVERNLVLAEKIKAEFPGMRIIFGGPEISEGSVSLAAEFSFVDYFVTGEGEWFFSGFLNSENIPHITVNNNKVAVQPSDELIAPSLICEPLTENRLNSNNDNSVFIELTRGCPYRCSYCYYSRSFKKVREISFDHLVAGIKSPMNYKEIYILSPTFDRSKDFIANLETLKNLDHNVRLHTEIRTDRIDKSTAELIYDAGFRSLEVGLQSMNRRALGNINRESNTEKELAGMHYLKNAGIELQIGIIPGLPGDSPEQFINTVNTLVDNELGDFIELYPLMILPGTQIRVMAEDEKVLFQHKPPYYFLEGWGFTSDDIRYISDYVEDRTGLSRSPFFLPDFTESSEYLFTKGLKFIGDNPDIWDIERFFSVVERSVMDFHITCSSEQGIYNGLEKLFLKSASAPDRLFNVILYSDLFLQEKTITEMILEYEKDSLHKRLNVFNSEAEASRFRFFQVSENISRYSRMDEEYCLITPVYMFTENSVKFTKTLHGESAVLIKAGVYDSISGYLKKTYSEDTQYVAFQSEEEMERFYKDMNAEYTKLPYNFGLLKI